MGEVTKLQNIPFAILKARLIFSAHIAKMILEIYFHDLNNSRESHSTSITLGSR